jgi:hypothetical protein
MMGLLFDGAPNGVLGMLLGLAAGALLILRAWRRAPWDIHDENSYREPTRLTLSAVAPTVILFVSLITLLLGTAVLDKDGVSGWLTILGDVLGILVLPFTIVYLMRDARQV